MDRPVIVPAVLAALAAALFGQAFARLRRRGRSDHASWGRLALFVAAIAIGLIALLSPLDAIADDRLSAHMLQHVLLGDLVPALLVLSVRGPLLVFLLPAPLLSPLARARSVRKAAGVLLRPTVAFAVWATMLGVWHVPALYDSVLQRPLLHELEHATFFLGGVLVWTQLIDPSGRGSLGPWARLGFAGAVFASGQALANVLLLASSPRYSAYGSLSDQRLAALVMMGEQLLTLGTFATFQLRRWLAAPLAPEPARHPLAL